MGEKENDLHDLNALPYGRSKKQRWQWTGEILLEYQIKYATKTFTYKDVADQKLKIKTPRKIFIKAYHNIISAMKWKRIFDRFGFKLPKVEKQKSSLRLLNEPYKE